MGQISITCPHCGRRGHMPDDRSIPKVIRCPACKTTFSPGPSTVQRLGESPAVELLPATEIAPVRPTGVPALPSRAEPPAVVPIEPRPVAQLPTRTCDFCGEAIQPTAKKCRHCGEILDPALRTAEEAKRLAARPAPAPAPAPVHVQSGPVIVHNTVISQSISSATAVAKSAERSPKSCCGCVSLLLLGVLFLLLLPAIVGTRPRPPTDTPVPQVRPVPPVTPTPADQPLGPEPTAQPEPEPAKGRVGVAEPVKTKEGAPKALRSGGPGAETRLKMARNMERLNPRAAPKYYQDVIKEFPDTTEAKQASTRLEELSRRRRDTSDSPP